MTRAGELVGGRYRLDETLGAGGFGRVWRARDEVLDVDVAVKELLLPPSVSDDERRERVTRALREARHAAKLREHPNVIGVLDVFAVDDTPWIVMQLVDGRSLQERLAAGGRLSEEQARRVALGVLDALAAAQLAGITHRDVKPANIMLASDGRVLLADFGIAVHDADTALTATGMFVGSLEYTAPERVNGEKATAAADLFSLGATLYEALEGVSPFRRDTAKAILKALLLDDPPAPEHAGPLGPLVMRLLAKEARHRPDVAEARRTVERLAATSVVETGKPRRSRGPQNTLRVKPPTRREAERARIPKERLGVLGWLLFVAVFGAVFGDFWSFNDLFESSHSSALLRSAGGLVAVGDILAIGALSAGAVKGALRVTGKAATAVAVVAFLVGGVATCFAFAGFFEVIQQTGLDSEPAVWVSLAAVAATAAVVHQSRPS